MIFDESTLRKLNQMELVATKVRAGVMKGERRSTKRGSSVEFADYRNYTPGDDLRRLDWNVYARLERPFIKLMEEEEDLAVHILLDGSRSMDWGEGDMNKFIYARRLAAALGAIALASGDRLTASLLYAQGSSPQFGPSRGQHALMRFLAFLEGTKAAGDTRLNQEMRSYALSTHRPGLAFLISDLFALDGYLPGLNQLQGRGYEVILLQVLSPDEIDPPLAGDLRLLDVESGHAQDVSLDGGMRSLYRKRLLAWQEEIQAVCRKRGIRYLPVTTSTTWDKIILFEMRRSGMVK